MPRRSRFASLALALAVGASGSADARPAKGRGKAEPVVPSEAVAPGVAPLPIGARHPQLHGIERQLELALPPKITPRVRPLVGRIGLSIDVALPASALTERLDAIDAPFQVGTKAIAGGTRITVVHPDREVMIALGRDRGEVVVAFGAEGEEVRLRALADDILRPLPEPTELGAELEVWQEAERVTTLGELPEAKRRWERLVEVPRFADLATVRIAELYVASGHVNEAMAELRAVSRRYPRSSGGALARLDVLQLEAITGLGIATPEQVDIASAAVERPGFAAYARLRAAAVLRELDEPALALTRMPALDTLPSSWQPPAIALRDDLLGTALAAPALRGDPRTSAIHWAAWSEQLGEHPERDAIIDAVAAAHERMGLFETSLPLLQARLRSDPGVVEEADIVGRMAHAYRMLGDETRAREAIDFQLATHPDAPGLADEVAAIATTMAARDGFLTARAWLVALRQRTTDAALLRALHRSEIELALGWGTPAQIVQSISAMPANASEPTLDPAAVRDRHELAVALVRSGRHAEAVGPLRMLIDRTPDPQERDRLAYHLALAELAQGRDADAVRILERIAGDGTRWGMVARARLHERRLDAAVVVLSSRKESVQ